MGGWGSTGLNVGPDGTVLPCHAAQTIDWMRFENVQDRSLSDIWHLSDSFNAFRGTAWMPEPCRGCDRKTVDFGGCRCQAMALAGDARATDPGLFEISAARGGRGTRRGGRGRHHHRVHLSEDVQGRIRR